MGLSFLENCGAAPVGEDNKDNFVLAIELRVNGMMKGKCLECQHRNSLRWPS